MKVLFLFLLFVLGSCIGSFLCCQARRLHLRHSNTSKSSKKPGSRSICLNCHKQLKWYDNIPIVSWLLLRGKCRYCHHKIGFAEILSELGVGIAFLLIGTTVDLGSSSVIMWLTFVFSLLLVSVLLFLAIYDGIYGELPTIVLILAIVLSIPVACFRQWGMVTGPTFNIDTLLNPLYGALIIGGLYLLLYLVSKGKWVGDGDWLLGVSIGLALASPWLALIALFGANLLACFVMLPFVWKNRKAKIYFGPFMVAAFIIVLSFADIFKNMI